MGGLMIPPIRTKTSSVPREEGKKEITGKISANHHIDRDDVLVVGSSDHPSLGTDGISSKGLEIVTSFHWNESLVGSCLEKLCSIHVVHYGAYLATSV
jgi:hypothetical protein